jgi:hypothetical protein
MKENYARFLLMNNILNQEVTGIGLFSWIIEY